MNLRDETNCREASPMTASRPEPRTFGVVAEFKNQGPILMEVEGVGSSRDAAEARADQLRDNRNCLRSCVVKLSFVSGNDLLLADLERLQR